MMKIELEVKTEEGAEELLLEFVRGVDKGLTEELRRMGLGEPSVILSKSGGKYYLRIELQGVPDVPSYVKRVAFRGLMKRLCSLIEEAVRRGGYKCEAKAVW